MVDQGSQCPARFYKSDVLRPIETPYSNNHTHQYCLKRLIKGCSITVE